MSRSQIDAREFWAYADVQADGCWLWKRARSSNGYGQVRWAGGRQRGAHVVAFELSSGSHVPPGVQVCHRCDVPACINPQHLFLGTAKDNTADAIAKGRYTQHLRQPPRMPRRFDRSLICRLRSEGLALKAIAARVGCSVGLVCSTLYRDGDAHVA